MAKKSGKGLPPYSRTSKTTGASPTNIKAGIKLAKDGGGRTVAKGIEGNRYSSTKPQKGVGISTGNAAADQKNTTLGRPYISTKPNK